MLYCDIICDIIKEKGVLFMKRVRIIAILTAVVLLTACCVIPASAERAPMIYLFGDVNFDEKLTVSDATDVQQAAAEMVEFNIYKSKTADINHDGFVTVADATLIQMVAAEMEIPEDCGGYILIAYAEASRGSCGEKRVVYAVVAD